MARSAKIRKMVVFVSSCIPVPDTSGIRGAWDGRLELPAWRVLCARTGLRPSRHRVLPMRS